MKTIARAALVACIALAGCEAAAPNGIPDSGAPTDVPSAGGGEVPPDGKPPNRITANPNPGPPAERQLWVCEYWELIPPPMFRLRDRRIEIGDGDSISDHIAMLTNESRKLGPCRRE